VHAVTAPIIDSRMSDLESFLPAAAAALGAICENEILAV
jgi:hypothetical protein